MRHTFPCIPRNHTASNASPATNLSVTRASGTCDIIPVNDHHPNVPSGTLTITSCSTVEMMSAQSAACGCVGVTRHTRIAGRCGGDVSDAATVWVCCSSKRGFYQAPSVLVLFVLAFWQVWHGFRAPLSLLEHAQAVVMTCHTSQLHSCT